MIDATEHISAVRREVGGRVLEAGTARVVTISRSYAAELADIWDACTNPERIPRWFLPVSGELKEGGRYQLAGNAGGTITRCDPPRGFDATWEMGGDMSWIELRLADEGIGRTLFRLNHIAHVDDQRWAQFGPGAVGVGWDSGLIGLYLHLTTGQAVDPARAAEWSASEEGHRFLTASSDAWYEASVRHRPGRDPRRRRPDHRVLHRRARARRGDQPARLTGLGRFSTAAPGPPTGAASIQPGTQPKRPRGAAEAAQPTLIKHAGSATPDGTRPRRSPA